MKFVSKLKENFVTYDFLNDCPVCFVNIYIFITTMSTWLCSKVATVNDQIIMAHLRVDLKSGSERQIFTLCWM